LAHQGTDSDRASALFREALGIDPGFARARAELALVYVHFLVFAPQRHKQTLWEMDELAQEALAHAPAHWASHLANGMLLQVRRDWLGADTAYATMTALASTSDSTAHFFHSLFLGSVGRNADAGRAIEIARSADPLSLAVSGQVLQDFYIAGRIADAEAEYVRTRDLPGNREPVEHTASFWMWDAGDDARSEAQLRRFLDTQAFPSPVLNEVVAVRHRPAEARAVLRRAFDDTAYQNWTQMMLFTWYAGRFGDTELAIAAMRRCYLDMNGAHVKAIWVPFLRDARKTSAFKQFVRDLGLYGYWRASGKWGDFARPVGTDDFECW
jgi:hypothetical protein